MAGEQFLLSGDQLGTFTGFSASFPPPNYTINLTVNGIAPLGSESDRFFLVRTQGAADPIANGDLFTIYPAIDDGSGGLVPDLSQGLFQGATATPDAYQTNGSDGLGAGDEYLLLGLFNGPRVIVKLDGLQGADTFSVARGEDNTGDDGELSIAEIEAANPDQAICFAQGAPITTIDGDKPVETLRVGDMVLTYDHGFQPIRWIGSSRVTFNRVNNDLVPIRIAAHALGPGQPQQPVTVSPAHRIFWSGPAAELLFGEREVLIPAKFLLNRDTIHRDRSAEHVTYWHFLFDDHEIVFSAGLKSESFFPAAYGTSTLARETRRELLQLFPELSEDGATGRRTARPSLRAYEFKALKASIDGLTQQQ